MNPELSARHVDARAESRYVLHEVIGRGASGTVYRAWDAMRGEHVALKVLGDTRATTLARLEAQRVQLGELRHPSLVVVYDVGTWQGAPYVTMQLVHGVELRTHLRREDAVGFDEMALVHCITLLVGALACLHARSLVHRDVKPSNVRVASDGTPVLLDYGILAHLDDLEDEPLGVGTPAYMSPEQQSGDAVGAPADFYALGVVMYEIMTGELPRRVDAGTRGTPRAPTDVRKRNPHVRTELAELCMALLARDPEARPDAREILRRLGKRPADAHAELPPRLDVTVPFVGRELELNELCAAVDAGSPCGFVHVRGAPGSGRSALVSAFTARMRERGVEALVAHCRDHAFDHHGALASMLGRVSLRAEHHQLTIDVEGASFARAMFPVLEALTDVARAHSDAPVPDPAERRFRAIRFVRALCALLCAQEPLVLCLDDVDHADPDTWDLLACLAREPIAGLQIVTTGSGPLPDDAPSHRTLCLGPLAADECIAVAHATFSAVGSEAPLDLVPPALGMHVGPWLELVRDRVLGGTAHDEAQGLACRIERASPRARRLLALVAVAERSIRRAELELAFHGDSRALREDLDALIHLALIELLPDDNEPKLRVPPRVATALLADGSPELIAELHHNWALALAGRGHVAALRAEHYRRAGKLDLAAEAAQLAAEEATRMLSFRRAAILWESVTRLAPPPAGDAGRGTWRALGDALRLAGRPRDALVAFERAAESAQSAEQLDLARIRAALLFRCADLPHGIEAIERVLAGVGLSLPKTSKRALWSLLWWRAKLGIRGLGHDPKHVSQASPLELMRIDVLLEMSMTFGLVDAFRGSELQARAIFLALRTGERTHLARAMIQEAYAQAAIERPPLTRTRKLLAAAEALNAETRDPESVATLRMIHGMISLFEFKAEEAARDLAAAEQRLRDECRDASVTLGNARQFLLNVHIIRADYREVRRLSDHFMHEARTRGDQYALSNIALLGGFLVALLDDDPARALAITDAAIAAWPKDTGFLLQHFYELLPRTWIGAYAGDPSTRSYVEERLPALEASLLTKAAIVRNTVQATLATAMLTSTQHESGSAREKTLAACLKIAGALRTAQGMSPMQSHVIDACVWTLHEDPARATESLDRALEVGTSLGIGTLPLRYARACLSEDLEAARAHATALRDQGVRNVPRFARIYVPIPLPLLERGDLSP